MPNPIYDLWEKIKATGAHPLGVIATGWKRVQAGRIAAAKTTARRLAGYASMRPGASLIPGTGVGAILTGEAALTAAASAFETAKTQYGPFMAELGRTVEDPRVVFEALKSSVEGRGKALFRPTPIGGQLGLRLAGDDVWLPTQYGPYLLTESRTSPLGVSLKVAGIRGRLEASTILAQSISKASDLKHSFTTHIRSFIQEQIRGLSGGKSADASILAAATGLHVDFLRAARMFDPDLLEALGKHPNLKRISDLKPGLYDKPESFLKGIRTLLDPQALEPFGMFAKGGRQLYQTVSYAPLLPGDVEKFETMAFGRRMPKLRTRLGAAAEKALGHGMPQGVVARIGVVSPSSALGRKLSEGLAGGTEAAFISERLSQLRYLSSGAAGKAAMASAQTVHQLGIGTALSVLGQKFNVAGIAPSSALAGMDMLIVADIEKDSAQYLKYLLGDAIYNSLNQSTGRLKKGFSQVASMLGIGSVSTAGIRGIAAKQSIALLTPSKNLLSMGFGQARKYLQKLALRMTGRSPLTPVATGLGPMRHLTGEFHVRMDMPIGPSWKGLKINPMDMIGMASMGESSSEVASRMLRYSVAKRSARARSYAAFLMPFTGAEINPVLFRESQTRKALYKRVTPAGINAELAKALQNVKDVRSLRAAVELLPESNLSLRLSEEIRLPTFEYFENVADPRLAATWKKWRGVGVPTKELALPSVGGLRGLLSRIEKEGRLEDAPVFIGKHVGAVGRVLERYLAFEKAPSEATRLALEEAVGIGEKSILSTLLAHTGKGRSVAEALHPRIPKGAYAVIQPGAEGVLKGARGLPAVRSGEVGVSAEFARNLGLSEELIRKIQYGGKRYYVGGQYYPSVVPEASRALRLRIFQDKAIRGLPGAANVVITNVADRLAAFRDLDFDRIMLYAFPSYLKQKLLRRAAWEQRKRANVFSTLLTEAMTKQGAAAASGSARNRAAAGLLGLTEEETARLFGQKVLTPQYHAATRLLQESIEKRFGGTSADAVRAAGVAYQIAGIKKGQGSVYDELFRISERVGVGGDLTKTTERLAVVLKNLGEKGRASNILLGFSEKRYRGVASQIAQGMQDVASLPSDIKQQALNRLVTGEPLGEAAALQVVGAAEATHGGLGAYIGRVQDYYARIMAPGKRIHRTGDLYSATARALESVNAATKQAGSLAEKAGGLWANLSMPWKIGLGIAGGLVGLRMIKSTLFGDEPEMQQSAGPPLPPEPIGMPGGLHDQLSRLPLPAFFPPTARVVSPLQRSPRVTMNATAPQGMDFGGLADSLAVAAMSSAGSPLAGVFSSDVSNTSRIDMNIAESLRSENRLYT